ncbi:17469_t:CDS:2 [Cetraspora pellucida]|uniref:17469_t:CDS:1 n=1 Tax=Cetraspora pellucida TaxID=1433469 RepID=A0A9N9A487_9GLOM|nr:17469_t:CDS:2 [Cetraspora pellucida]
MTQYNSPVYSQSPQHAQQSSLLNNPTIYHLEQIQRRNGNNVNSMNNMIILANDEISGTPNNSFNSSTLNPTILNAAQNQFFAVGPGHIKQETGSMDVTEGDIDPQVVCSPMTSPSPANSVGSPITRNYDRNFIDDANNLFGQSYKPSHMDSFSPFDESPSNVSVFSQGPAETKFFDQSDPNQNEVCSISAPTGVSAFEFRQPQSNFVTQPQSLPAGYVSGGECFPQYTQGLQYLSEIGAAGSGVRLYQQHYIDAEDSADSAQKQAILIEKRRRRRESHNAVERRRRDNINEKIQEISTLIPDIFIDSSNKPNKGVILRKAVEYIKHLQQLVGEQRAHNLVLENTISDMKSGIPIENNSEMNVSPQSSGIVNNDPYYV